MHQSWDNLNSNFIGSTSVMSNTYEGQPWFNQQRIQIKSEPMEFNARDTPPQTARQQMSPLLEHITPFRQMGVFNPLTPPGYSGLMFPSYLGSQDFPKQETPSKAQDLSKTSSSRSENTSITPPMDVTPPKSPLRERTITQTPDKDDFNGLETRSESVESYDEESDEFEDDGSTVGTEKSKKRKSSGNNKPRQYKCKQCKLPFHSKREFWDHTRSHIKPEKMLQCPKCAFVTEYKHHLEYHLRNHSRVKPFRCPHCNYSCVNKSMLNSHLKSHSTVLQYRCLDCNYATKYCHSLKLHLRKYDHKPDIVLNLDGTPNPLPIIDVYGTRRGPKSKSTTSKLLAEIEKNQQQQQQAQKTQLEFNTETAQKSQLSPPLTPSNTSLTNVSDTITHTPPSSIELFKMLQNQMLQSKMPLFPYFNLNFQMLAAQQQAQMDFNDDEDNDEGCVQTGEADTNFIENASPVKRPETLKTGSRTKRKGKAFKLKASHSDDDFNGNELTSPITTIEKVTSSITNEIAEKANSFECKFCGISFHDNVLFSLHIGYHSVGDDPFKCNMCGTKTEDKVQFFLHIAKFPHS